jgi:hypothetical protein
MAKGILEVISMLLYDENFYEQLDYLNNAIIKSLDRQKLPPIISGNLFYEPKVTLNRQLEKECSHKRERLCRAVIDKKMMFEIGINGGHSAFLTLYSNSELILFGNDLSEPFDNLRPDIYTPAACAALNDFFPNRFHYLLGDCLTVVPNFVKNNDIKFDIIHIDGNKDTYSQDFINLKPALVDQALVIFDDSNIPRVKYQIDELKKLYVNLQNVSEFDKIQQQKYQNQILRYTI